MTSPVLNSSGSNLPAEVLVSLLKSDLIDADTPIRCGRLTGGVASDIWKVETPQRAFCVKRALPRLRVKADWRAPADRTRYEVAWCRIANRIVPGIAPEILYHDDDAMLCAMSYLDPAIHSLWKEKLRDGDVRTEDAAEVGRRLVGVHAATAGDPEVAAAFPNEGYFAALRLEPFFEAAAEHHDDLADALFALSRRTAATKLVMVHGDISPKNILIGPAGPVILDAECACLGDPAFDLAYCLNHLLPKCLWRPALSARYLACFEAMSSAYMDGVRWESLAVLERRATSLLAGLLLARVDGKSPVEYITDDNDKNRVRRVARDLIVGNSTRLDEALHRWQRELAA